MWLRYINETPEDKEVLDILLRDSAMRTGDIALFTSTIAMTEVAYGAAEQNHQALDADVEQKIDSHRSVSHKPSSRGVGEAVS